MDIIECAQHAYKVVPMYIDNQLGLEQEGAYIRMLCDIKRDFMDVVTSIEYLEGTLKKFCPAIFKNLNPGLSKEQLEVLLTDDSANYEQIKEIYQWKNGTSESFLPEGRLRSFHICGNLLPLEYALTFKSELDNMHLYEGNFFPLLYNNEGNVLLMDIGSTSPTCGMLFILSETIPTLPLRPAYDSFHKFSETMMHLFGTTAYKFDNTNNFLVVVEGVERDITAYENPNSTFWS